LTEAPAKVNRIFKAALKSNLVDGQVCFAKQSPGMADPDCGYPIFK
jgi:hypothetical protein